MDATVDFMATAITPTYLNMILTNPMANEIKNTASSQYSEYLKGGDQPDIFDTSNSAGFTKGTTPSARFRGIKANNTIRFLYFPIPVKIDADNAKMKISFNHSNGNTDKVCLALILMNQSAYDGFTECDNFGTDEFNESNTSAGVSRFDITSLTPCIDKYKWFGESHSKQYRIFYAWPDGDHTIDFKKTESESGLTPIDRTNLTAGMTLGATIGTQELNFDEPLYIALGCFNCGSKDTSAIIDYTITPSINKDIYFIEMVEEQARDIQLSLNGEKTQTRTPEIPSAAYQYKLQVEPNDSNIYFEIESSPDDVIEQNIASYETTYSSNYTIRPVLPVSNYSYVRGNPISYYTSTAKLEGTLQTSDQHYWMTCTKDKYSCTYITSQGSTKITDSNSQTLINVPAALTLKSPNVNATLKTSCTQNTPTTEQSLIFTLSNFVTFTPPVGYQLKANYKINNVSYQNKDTITLVADENNYGKLINLMVTDLDLYLTKNNQKNYDYKIIMKDENGNSLNSMTIFTFSGIFNNPHGEEDPSEEDVTVSVDQITNIGDKYYIRRIYQHNNPDYEESPVPTQRSDEIWETLQKYDGYFKGIAKEIDWIYRLLINGGSDSEYEPPKE